jgi:penicillin-binding protein 1A
VADGLAAYERRHGWKGKLENVLAAGPHLDDYKHPDWAMSHPPGDYVHAWSPRPAAEIHARVGAEPESSSLPEDWQWTGQRFGDALVKPGDIIYVHLSRRRHGRHAAAPRWSRTPAPQGSLMAMDNTTGDVLAMVGGRDYALSQFNRATQAERQTGSSFKPYVYTAAIEDGAKPDDIIVDSPVSFGGYTPHNYENDYKGAMTSPTPLPSRATFPRSSWPRASAFTRSSTWPTASASPRTFPPICRSPRRG